MVESSLHCFFAIQKNIWATHESNTIQGAILQPQTRDSKNQFISLHRLTVCFPWIFEFFSSFSLEKHLYLDETKDSFRLIELLDEQISKNGKCKTINKYWWKNTTNKIRNQLNTMKKWLTLFDWSGTVLYSWIMLVGGKTACCLNVCLKHHALQKETLVWKIEETT